MERSGTIYGKNIDVSFRCRFVGVLRKFTLPFSASYIYLVCLIVVWLKESQNVNRLRKVLSYFIFAFLIS